MAAVSGLYDPEDERTTSAFGTTSYNVRGEIVVQQSGTPPAGSMSANGFLINTQPSPGWSVAYSTTRRGYRFIRLASLFRNCGARLITGLQGYVLFEGYGRRDRFLLRNHKFDRRVINLINLRKTDHVGRLSKECNLRVRVRVRNLRYARWRVGT